MISTWDFVFGWLALTGFTGVVLMGFDKHQARIAGKRIPERSFLTLALIGGAFGILLGGGAFHHKTRKGSFMGVVLVAAALWAGGIFELARVIGFPS